MTSETLEMASDKASTEDTSLTSRIFLEQGNQRLARVVYLTQAQIDAMLEEADRQWSTS